MTTNRMYHPESDIDRLNISGIEGGEDSCRLCRNCRTKTFSVSKSVGGKIKERFLEQDFART